MTTLKELIINMILVILVWISVLTKVEAEQCMEGQHCVSCASNSHCLAKCNKGYYGIRCDNTCSPGCRRNSCILKNKCTFGCKHGFYGNRCFKPCKTHTDICRKCPQKCDRGICQFGWSCAKGCQDSYYGTSCKSCQAGCEVCDRVSGTCEDNGRCTGNCTHRCLGGCQPGACLECKSGWFGSTCENLCPKRCVDKQCDKDGICIHGCKKRWYGPRCESRCETGCDRRLCNSKGICSYGCREGFYGDQCQNQCSPPCLKRLCDIKDGSCKSCEKPYNVGHCNMSCVRCVSGSCSQDTGHCLLGCMSNYRGEFCQYDCAGNCTAEACLNVCRTYYEEGSHDVHYVIIGVSLIFINLLVAVVYVTFHFKRGLSLSNSNTDTQQHLQMDNLQAETGLPSSVTEGPQNPCGPSPRPAEGCISDVHEYVNIRGLYQTEY